MLGLGKSTKRIVRSITEAMDDTRARAKHRPAYFRRKMIEAEAPFVKYGCYILDSHNIVFLEVPKASSSYVLRKLLEFAGTAPESVGNVHKQSRGTLKSLAHVGSKRFSDILDAPDRLVFTVVRNPFIRALSCYSDKFEKVVIGDGSYISDLVLAANRFCGFPVETGRPLTWEEYVDFAALTAPMTIDGHWAPQSALLPRRSMPIDQIAHVESLGEDLTAIFRQRGASQSLLDSLTRPHERLADGQVDRLRSGTTAQTIRSVYAADFARFGYSTDLPAAEADRPAAVRTMMS